MTNTIRLGLPVTPERSDIVRIVNIAWQKSFVRIEENKRAIAARGLGPLNYILLDHPGLLQDIKDRVRTINEIYEKHIRDGADITDLATLNTEQRSRASVWTCFLLPIKKREATADGPEKKGARGQAFCWPRGHHGRLRDRSPIPRVGS
jgi:hypothetical protein